MTNKVEKLINKNKREEKIKAVMDRALETFVQARETFEQMKRESDWARKAYDRAWNAYDRARDAVLREIWRTN